MRQLGLYEIAATSVITITCDRYVITTNIAGKLSQLKIDKPQRDVTLSMSVRATQLKRLQLIFLPYFLLLAIL